jgi:hypothetical protein
MTYLVKVFHRNFTNSLDIYSVLSKTIKENDKNASIL